MKNIIFAAGLLLNVYTMYSQSFTATTLANITTTASGSRSANFVDVNGDGWDDIFFSNGPSGGQNNMLYINNTDGTFTTITSGDIVSDQSSSDGASFADVDNDGDLDVFVVTWAGGAAVKNFFYRNDGNGLFTYDPNVAMGVYTYSEMPTWIDANNDQKLDLYFTNSAGSATNRYFENQGDGSFLAVTNLSITSEILGTRSVDWIDYDNDGDSDLFLTNENNSKNSLFRNDGPNNFTKITNNAITEGLKSSSGSSWGDIDNDGDFDLFVANWNNQTNQLFINDNGVFIEKPISVIASGGGNSFGSSFADIDNDGDLDLYVCNAFSNTQTNNFIYINDGQGNFTQDTTSNLATHSGWTFGCAFGDYNNDGWLDLILANTYNENQTNALFQNTGSGNNWVKFNCKGLLSNTSAVGAKVRIKTNTNGTDVWQTRKIVASTGYNSQNSYTVHFGLGNATEIETLEITWPIGTIQTFTNLSNNTTYNIVEGMALGISEFIIESRSKIYPNPVKDTLNLKVALTMPLSGLTLKIFDLKGTEIMKTEKFDPLSQSINKKINVSYLQTGTYICSLMTSSNQSLLSGKFIKND